MNTPYHHKALPAGTQLREWVLEDVLGAGGFAIVYRGRGVYFGETVAIKEYFPAGITERVDGITVTPTDSNSEETYSYGLQKFVDEARILWNLSRPDRHPNLVCVRALFEIHGTAYMVMDFEDGVPLSRVLRMGRTFDEATLLPLFRPLCEGLERAHNAGVYHRDIKPANILVNPDQRPVLIDFGSARFDVNQGTNTRLTFYTPPYAALEQYVRTYQQGAWTDIYAMGVTLFQCITGTKPAEALERAHSDGGKKLAEQHWPGFSPQFLAAVDAALEIWPQNRPQTLAAWLAMFPTAETAIRLPVPDVVPAEAGVPESLGTASPAPDDDDRTSFMPQPEPKPELSAAPAEISAVPAEPALPLNRGYEALQDPAPAADVPPAAAPAPVNAAPADDVVPAPAEPVPAAPTLVEAIAAEPVPDVVAEPVQATDADAEILTTPHAILAELPPGVDVPPVALPEPAVVTAAVTAPASVMAPLAVPARDVRTAAATVAATPPRPGAPAKAGKGKLIMRLGGGGIAVLIGAIMAFSGGSKKPAPAPVAGSTAQSAQATALNVADGQIATARAALGQIDGFLATTPPPAAAVLAQLGQLRAQVADSLAQMEQSRTAAASAKNAVQASASLALFGQLETEVKTAATSAQALMALPTVAIKAAPVEDLYAIQRSAADLPNQARARLRLIRLDIERLAALSAQGRSGDVGPMLAEAQSAEQRANASLERLVTQVSILPSMTEIPATKDARDSAVATFRQILKETRTSAQALARARRQTVTEPEAPSRARADFEAAVIDMRQTLGELKALAASSTSADLRAVYDAKNSAYLGLVRTGLSGASEAMLRDSTRSMISLQGEVESAIATAKGKPVASPAQSETNRAWRLVKSGVASDYASTQAEYEVLIKYVNRSYAAVPPTDPRVSQLNVMMNSVYAKVNQLFAMTKTVDSAPTLMDAKKIAAEFAVGRKAARENMAQVRKFAKSMSGLSSSDE